MLKVTFTICFLILSLILSGQSTQGMSLVFSDDFTTSDKGWSVDESSFNISKVSPSNKRLVLEIFDQGMKRSTVFTDVDFNKDFVLKAELGSKGEAKQNKNERSDFGLTFGYSSPRYWEQQGVYGFYLNFYRDGIYVFSQYPNGTRLLDEIIKDVNYNPKSYVDIAVEKRGTNVSFFVNGKEIMQSNAIETAGGAISFRAFRKMKCYMRNIEIYQNPVKKEENPTHIEEIDILLENIEFYNKSVTLKEGAEELISELAEVLRSNPEANFILESHCDDAGSTNALIKLTNSRYEVLKDRLVQNGIEKSRISGKGIGDFRPITSNLSSEGRKRNNRLTYQLSWN